MIGLWLVTVVADGWILLLGCSLDRRDTLVSDSPSGASICHSSIVEIDLGCGDSK